MTIVDCKAIAPLIDTGIAFLLAASIIFIGFLAYMFFKKTGWPEILLLILIGIIIGPVLGLFSKQDFLPALPLISTFTLLMILFQGGLELNISEVVSGSLRGLFQAFTYFFLGMVLISVFLHFVMNWAWIESFLLGSILSQTSNVVIIPFAKKIKLRPQSVTLLSLEAIMTSIFNIVFFYALLQTQLLGNFDTFGTIIQILLNFIVGAGVGILMGILWLKLLPLIGKNELAYMVTIGYVFLCYFVSDSLMGSGPLSVLTLGLVLGNDDKFLVFLRMRPADPSFAELKNYLTRFQVEISFILRAFFFVLLGLFFVISIDSLSTFLLFGLPIIGILLVTRFLVVSISTRGTAMYEERNPIIALCALGMTPVLLSFIALQSNLPMASLYILIVTNVIIVTNIITSVTTAVLQSRKSGRPLQQGTKEEVSHKNALK